MLRKKILKKDTRDVFFVFRWCREPFTCLYYAFQPSGDVPQNVYESFCKVFAKFLVSLKREPFLSGGYELGLSWDRLFEFLGLDIPTWLKRILQK